MPTAPPDCLAGLIGLSAAGSACFPLPAVVAPATNAAITESRSGLYLDRVEGLLLKPTSGQSAGGELYARLDAARAQAGPLVRAELAKGRALATGAARYEQRGTLGGPGNGQLLPAGTPARMLLHTLAQPFGAWRILGLQLYTDVPVTAAPVLLDGLPIGTLSGSGPGGALVPLAGAGLRIPFDGAVHTLEVTLPAGVRLFANNLWCSSCQRHSPWGQSLGRSLLAECAGYSGGGLAVQVQEECTESLDPLCFAIAAAPELGAAVALAVQYKAAELFILSLSVGAQASRYLMLEPKELDALREYYAAKNHNPGDGFLPWLSGPDGLGRIQHPCYFGAPARLGIIRTT